MEASQEFHPCRRPFDERLEQEVVQQVVTPDVGDERDHGRDLRNVGEVLVRPHAHIGAPGHAQPIHGPEHLEVAALVGDQVVRVEIAARLRDSGHQRREIRIG
jgi:hypothetical protein